MIKHIRKLFTPKMMSEANRTRTADLLNTTLIIALVPICFFLVVLIIIDASQVERSVIGLGLLLLIVVARRLLHKGRIWLASSLLLGGFWLAAVHSSMAAGGGTRFPDAATYILYIVVAGSLLGGRAAFLFAGLNIIFRTILFWLDSQGLLPVTPAPPASFLLLGEFLAYLISAWYLGLAATNLEKAFGKIQQDQDALAATNQALQASEEFMRQITDNVQGLIAYVDTQERFRFANSTFAQWYCRPLDQIINHTIRELVGDAVYLRRQHRQRALGGEKFTFEDTFPYPDGVTRTVLGSYTPHLDANGVVLGFYISAVDISERKQGELRNAQLLAEMLEQRQRLRRLNQQVATAQENERKAIAQELHDSIGQNLTVIGLNLNILRVKLNTPQPVAGPLLARIDDTQQVVQETARQVRTVLSELRPPLLQEEGLLAALRSLAATMTKRTGLPITVTGNEPSPPLAEVVALGLFRVAQEALNNVIKHAQATAATLSLLAEQGNVRLLIVDNGRGLALAQAERTEDQQNWGMLTMRERVQAIGGEWQVDSPTGQGTTISVRVQP